MEVNFEHEIGDVLTTRAARKGMEIRMSQFGRHPIAVSMLLTVVGRQMCECPVGIQLEYRCRIEGIGEHENIMGTYVTLKDIELTDDLSTLQTEEDVSRKEG